MKRAAMVMTLVTSMGIGGSALAGPPLGGGVKKVTVSDSDALTPAKKFTAADAVKKNPKFSATKTYRTASGTTITGQQFLDLANKLQAAAEKGGCDLGSGKRCNFVVKEAKLGAAELGKAAKKAASNLGLKASALASAPSRAKSPLGFSWYNDWGNEKTAAVYVGADFRDDGAKTAAACGGAAYAGVYLFNNKHDVVRLEGEVSSAGSTTSASAALYVLGEQVWSKSGAHSTSKPLSFEKSFTAKKSFTYWGLITLNLKAKATAGASLSTSLGGVAKANEYACQLVVTPGVSASVDGSAEVAILGYGDLSAAAVGVDADIVLADVKVPVTVSAGVKGSGNAVTFTESIDVSLDMTYLKGSLDVYFKTSFPLDGEAVWDWDKDKFSFTILEWDGYKYKESLYKKTATQTL